MESSSIHGGDYAGPAYEFTSSVGNLRRLPRFGHGSDFTAVLSSDRDDQADYIAGLLSLFLFLLIIFAFWTVSIITFRVMGPTNAGFLSGYCFVVLDPANGDKSIHKRPWRVRIAFMAATAALMAFAFVFVAMGLTNVKNASVTVESSLETTKELIENAEGIARKLERVGVKSIEIRDAAVSGLDNICPMDPNIADAVGLDIMGIAEQARSDLTMLANFIRDGLKALNENLALVRDFAESAAEGTKKVEFWGWQMKLLAAGLFILPSFLAVGVGLVMLDLDVEPYQKLLTYFLMPLFMVTIVACYVVCCAVLPVSATTADACSGGGDLRGGPDDTVLTVYRNLRGGDTGPIFEFVGYYTQRCDPRYYPFEFLSDYLNKLDEAIDSTDYAVDVLGDSQGLLEQRCGRNFNDVIEIVGEMNENLVLLQTQAYASLDLVKCENINRLYVNTVHEAGCTYSVDALAWIFASSLVISVCGMIMITLRAAYYPVAYLELGDSWSTGPNPSMDISGPSGRASKYSAEGMVPGVGQQIEGGTNRTFGSMAPAGKVVLKERPPVVVPGSIKVAEISDDEFEMSHTGEEF